MFFFFLQINFLSLIENGGFTFTSGVTDQTNERQRCFQGRKRTTARSSENNKTTPSCSVFKCPPIFGNTFM